MTDNAGALSAQGLTLGYGENTVLRDLDLKVSPRKFTALLGPNGSGKSTLLKVLARLQSASPGSMLLDGSDIQAMPSKLVARQISLLPQGAVAPEGLTVLDLVRQGRYPHRPVFGGWSDKDEMSVRDALAKTALDDLGNRFLQSLSGGQRQRAWIAMVLAQQAPVLLLDEPTTYLDLAHQIDLMELIRSLVDNEAMTVVAVLHDLNQAARYCDELVFLKDGEIAEQGPVDLVFRPSLIREVFDVEADVLQDPRTARPYCLPHGRPGAESGQ